MRYLGISDCRIAFCPTFTIFDSEGLLPPSDSAADSLPVAPRHNCFILLKWMMSAAFLQVRFAWPSMRTDSVLSETPLPFEITVIQTLLIWVAARRTSLRGQLARSIAMPLALDIRDLCSRVM